MLNDNAPALSSDNSTKEMPIQGSSIKKQIEMQESLIKEREQAISIAYSDIRLAEDMLAHLKSFDNRSSKNKTGAVESGSPLSKKQMVYTAIIETSDIKGIMIPEIKESIFKKYGVSVSPTTIDDKANELIKENNIYQVNEGRKRGKRYLAKK